MKCGWAESRQCGMSTCLVEGPSLTVRTKDCSVCIPASV